jgi:hypothetical protein
MGISGSKIWKQEELWRHCGKTKGRSEEDVHTRLDGSLRKEQSREQQEVKDKPVLQGYPSIFTFNQIRTSAVPVRQCVRLSRVVEC